MKENQYSSRELLKRFIPYYGNYKKLFYSDMFAALLTIVAEVSLPLIVRSITNIASNNIEELSVNFLIKVTVLYMFLKIIEIVSNFYMQKYGHIMGAKIERDMRKDIFTHIQHLSDEFYSTTKIGQLLSRVTTDLFQVTEFAHHCPEEFLVAFVKTLVIFIILININLTMTLVMFILLPLMFILTHKSRREFRAKQLEQRQQIGEINSNVQDSLLGIRVVKSFANEDLEIENFDKSNYTFLVIKSEFYNAMAKFFAITKSLDALMYLSVIFIGGILLINQKIQVGDFIIYTMYTSALLATITRLINFMEVYENGLTGIARFFELMDVEPDLVDKEDAIELKNVKGHIVFNNVTFAYNNNSDNPDLAKIVLKDIDLDIKPGTKIAIVGPSGGGKTTLTNLIPRFYDIDEGEILIDGHDVRNLQLKSLRENIGMVHQDVYLFSGTLAENISYGKLDASKEEILEACRLAGAMEFIEKLPHGIDTYVGERGVMLSGGQKQRISIARVFLKNPPILILDEATSALDNKSEQIVQESLELLSEGRTTITIAHRLSTIINADKIIVLTEDGIQETGTHRELLERKGEYYKLYNKVDNHIMG